MSDRIRHVTVTLDADYRDDDAAPILAAIRQVRGVSIVEPSVVDVRDLLARAAVEADVRVMLHEAIEGVFCKQDDKEPRRG